MTYYEATHRARARYLRALLRRAPSMKAAAARASLNRTALFQTLHRHGVPLELGPRARRWPALTFRQATYRAQCRYLRAALRETPNVSEVARRAGLNRAHLYRILTDHEMGRARVRPGNAAWQELKALEPCKW